MDTTSNLVSSPTTRAIHPALPYLGLVAGILGLSFSALFVRWSQAPGTVTAFFRMGLATVFLAPVFVPRVKPTTFARRLWVAPLLGGILSALDHATWNTAIAHTRVANATLLNNTAPIWVALVAWLLFRERLRPAFWLGLLLALGGAAVVLGNDLFTHPSLSWGDLIALFSGLFYAAYYLVTQRGRDKLDTITYMGVTNIFSCLTLLAISLIGRMPLTGFSTETYLAFIGAALISQLIGHLSLSFALGHLPASVVAPTMIAQPVLTALLAIPLAHEPLMPAQWIGGLSVLAGITIVNNNRQS